MPTIMEMTMADVVHIQVHLEDGAFWATVDEHPGVFATGDDLDELRESLQEGISLVLAEDGQEPPAITLGPLNLPDTVASTAQLAYA